MNRMYLDMTDHSCRSIFMKDTEIIPAGTTVYSMQVKDKNDAYEAYADRYDIHFIFDDDIPTIDFYSIPRIDIMAVDSLGGFLGTLGEACDPESHAPICYIDRHKNCFLIAQDMKGLLNNPGNWRERAIPCEDIHLFHSKGEAMKNYNFVDSPVKKISDHFWILEDSGVRSFLFEGKEKAMLVDTGFGTLPLDEMTAGLTDLPVFVVNTHADRDHTGCNKDFSPVFMHPSEMDRYKIALPKDCTMENVRPLWEGDTIDLGYWNFEVILTPGHTPGSIMLLEREKRMLISGDTIQNGDIYMFGPGRNMPAFQYSLKKMMTMSDAFDSIWPSHGSYPLTPDIIPGILKGSEDLLAGKLSAQEPPHPMPCKKYACEAAGFLYQFE